LQHLRSLLRRPSDPGHLALQKGIRVAIVAPLTFAFFLEVVGSSEAALFGAFGAFAFLGFADFGGAPWPRARAYLTLTAVGAGLVALGTLVSGELWVAAAVMVVVGFSIRFVGFFGGSFNAAVSPAILSFVLGVTVEGSASDIGPRAGGWVLAGGFATVVALVLWPRRQRLATRAAAGRACEALADAVDAFGDPAGPSPAQRAAVSAALVEVRRQATMPTRPAGPGAHDAALTLLVEQVQRTGVLVEAQAEAGSATTATVRPAGEHTLRFTVATLRVAARALLAGDAIPEPVVLVEERDALRDEEIAAVVERLRRGDDPSDAVRDLDATFIVRAAGFLAVSIATNAAVLMGGSPAPDDDASIAPFIEAPRAGDVRRRLVATVRSQLTLSSPWFQDSARAGVALGVAVFVALLTSVDHAFWVALGTLSVLRSNAFDTGRSAFEAAAGTAAGFAVAAAVLAVVGVDRTGLWIVMIVGFFCAAYFPVVLGFVAGQAAFTVLVVALFNLMVPQGWRTGLVRTEDIVIGVTVSVVVSLVFWPRRAEVGLRHVAAALYRALGVAATAPDLEHRRAVRACARRADAAYTQYLAETAAAPERRRPWGLLLAAADTAHNGLRFLEFDRAQMGDGLCPQASVALDSAATALGRDWEAIGEGIEDHGRPPPAPGDWITAADSTRGPVVSCLTAHADVGDAPAAVRAAFAREWLLALTELTAPVAASVGDLH
jgi:uncharacterized membrane protein YccC